MSTLTGWLVALSCLFAWVFLAVRIQEIMYRRHVETDCFYGWGVDTDWHTNLAMLGWLFAPLLYIAVVAYQLADGTTKRHLTEAWHRQRTHK